MTNNKNIYYSLSPHFANIVCSKVIGSLSIFVPELGFNLVNNETMDWPRLTVNNKCQSYRFTSTPGFFESRQVDHNITIVIPTSRNLIAMTVITIDILITNYPFSIDTDLNGCKDKYYFCCNIITIILLLKLIQIVLCVLHCSTVLLH